LPWKSCFARIHIDCEQNGADLTLRIGDDGPGFGGADAAPGSSPENEFVSGVGLLIVQDIAELYDGTVETGNSTLGGAEIVVTLPAGPTLT